MAGNRLWKALEKDLEGSWKGTGESRPGLTGNAEKRKAINIRKQRAKRA